MARRKRLLIDVDEVLVDFQTPALGALERLTGRRLTPEDYEVWDMFSLFSEDEKKAVFAEIEKPGFCRALEPKPGAISALHTLREIVDIFAVTSHFTSPTWVHERDAQLTEVFGFKRREIVHTSAKYLIGGDYFLDDNPAHVTAWMEERPTGVAMLWHIPNTRKLGMDDIRMRSWEDVVRRVRSTLSYDPVTSMWSKARKRAQTKKVPFTIHPKDIRIPTHCPVFGFPLRRKEGRGPGDRSPSLDRVDRTRGYEPGNVEVISAKANRIKNDSTLDELKQLVQWLESRRVTHPH